MIRRAITIIAGLASAGLAFAWASSRGYPGLFAFFIAAAAGIFVFLTARSIDEIGRTRQEIRRPKIGGPRFSAEPREGNVSAEHSSVEESSEDENDRGTSL